MKITIDTDSGKVITDENGSESVYDIGDPKAFSLISNAYLRSGWDAKYVYSFAWMGRPIIQLPDDMMRIQELIYSVKPDVIMETGVAHGGSLIFYASLCKAMEKGRVVGVDIEIRPHNREAIESHFLFPYITLIEGSSIEEKIVSQVRQQIKPSDKVIVFLDSCHTKEHVLAELKAYSSIVSPGSYIVAMDGIMGHLPGAPRTEPDWKWNNPQQAAIEFVKENADFEIVEPELPFNEGDITERVTYWPDAFLLKKQ